MPGMFEPTAVSSSNVQLRREFDELRGKIEADGGLMQLVSVINTDTPTNVYAWMGQLQPFREWIGQRAVTGLKSHSYTIALKQYELTVGVDENMLDDAKLITEQAILQGMAEEAAYLPRKLIIDVLINGTSLRAYDGQNFFDTDHPQDPSGAAGSQANYTASSFGLTAANFRTARQRLQAFKGENGRPLGTGLGPLLLIIPPELESTADDILALQNIAVVGGTQNNLLFNAARKLVLPELSADSATKWYLADPSGVVKPIILQRRTTTRFTRLNRNEDVNRFWHKEYIWGADMRIGAAPGAWSKIYKGNA